METMAERFLSSRSSDWDQNEQEYIMREFNYKYIHKLNLYSYCLLEKLIDIDWIYDYDCNDRKENQKWNKYCRDFSFEDDRIIVIYVIIRKLFSLPQQQCTCTWCSCIRPNCPKFLKFI